MKESRKKKTKSIIKKLRGRGPKPIEETMEQEEYLDEDGNVIHRSSLDGRANLDYVDKEVRRRKKKKDSIPVRPVDQLGSY